MTGDPGSGRTTLGIRFAKVLSKSKGETSARIAKIYAEDFNNKDIPSTIAKIAGGTLIIEEAADLKDEIVKADDHSHGISDRWSGNHPGG